MFKKISKIPIFISGIIAIFSIASIVIGASAIIDSGILDIKGEPTITQIINVLSGADKALDSLKIAIGIFSLLVFVNLIEAVFMILKSYDVKVNIMIVISLIFGIIAHFMITQDNGIVKIIIDYLKKGNDLYITVGAFGLSLLVNVIKFIAVSVSLFKGKRKADV